MVRLIVDPDKLYNAGTDTLVSSSYLAGFDAAMATLDGKGVKALLTIAGGNRFRRSLPDPAAWAGAARAVLERYQARYPGIFTGVEVGNEPNGTWNYGLRTPAEQGQFTARLTKTIHDELARSPAGAGLPIIGGATIGIYGGKLAAFWEAAFDAGLLNSVHGVSFHYYNDTDDLLRRVPALRKAIVAHGGPPDLPLYMTECCAAKPEKAYRTSRGPTLAVAAGIDTMVYFPMMDEPAIGWPVQGLVTADGQLKPPALVLARWVDLFEGATFARVALGPDVIAFDASNGIRIAWSQTEATIAIDPGLKVEDMYGNRLPPAKAYQLGNDPIYIFGGSAQPSSRSRPEPDPAQ
jgi:hypothetical protein